MSVYTVRPLQPEEPMAPNPPPLCRSEYQSDTETPPRWHHSRIVRCGLLKDHPGDHDEMIDGEAGVVTWPRAEPKPRAARDAAEAERDEARAENLRLAGELDNANHEAGAYQHLYEQVCAQRDRMWPVVEAAETWAQVMRLVVGTGRTLGPQSQGLLDALDAYWTPAKPGDTPGVVEPGEDVQIQPIGDNDVA